VICLLPSAGWSITAGQVDTFIDGTTQNWAGGASPTNISTGGPAGAGDPYLRISTVGGGLAARNDVQWAGDYLSAGVTAVSMEMRNEGSTDLSMRVVLFNSPGGDFTSTSAVLLPADHEWHHLVFGLTAADLTHVGGGSGNLNDTLGNVVRLLFRHQAGPPSGASAPTPVTGILGVDNITAVPEPASALLTGAALGLAIYRVPRSCKNLKGTSVGRGDE
jgi:hypothetical protein